MGSMADPMNIVSLSAAATTSLSTEDATVGDFSTQTVYEPEANVFIAAQRGDVALLRTLIDSGAAKATDRDSQNITPLHWAAINAQLPAVQYLLTQGAEVDALGGDLVATPMQWAARNGYVYIIQALVAHGADVGIMDTQGYNTLHLVTHSSNVMALLYVLHQPVAVDCRDSQGHTSLMWAAYQGDAISVDILLRHGADPNAVDESGLSPLHWAVVKGNRNCIRKLVEAGSNVKKTNGEGKTPREMAEELKSVGAWKRALEEGGMNEEGVKKVGTLSERNTKMSIFILPTIFLCLIFTTLKTMPWYTGIVLAMAEFFALHHIVTRVLLDASSYTDGVVSSPYYAGIISGSLVWVGYSWATRLITQTESHPIAHLTFALSFGLSSYNFARAITLDPGFCPKPANDGELRAAVEELAAEGRLNSMTFCVSCMARKPLRSKHCRICDKCVARHDHHCPWVWNCVGVHNHRQFLIFVFTLVTGIISFDYLSFQYFAALIASPSSSPSLVQPSPSCPLPNDLCTLTATDPFLFSVALWSTLQLLWTSVLLVSQLYQVMRQMTTFEVSNLGRYGFMGGRGGQSLATQFGAGGSMVGQEDAVGSPHPHGANGHKHDKGCTRLIMSLTGLDVFTRGRAAHGLSKTTSGRANNPFDLGLLGNCKDFWSTGRVLGVEYERLYDVPPEGFREAARRRREIEKAEEEEGRGRKKGGPGLSRWTLGFGGRRSGYEPVAQQV